MQNKGVRGDIQSLTFIEKNITKLSIMIIKGYWTKDKRVEVLGDRFAVGPLPNLGQI